MMVDSPYRIAAARERREANEPQADGEFLGLWLFLWAISLVRLVGGAWMRESLDAEGAIALLVLMLASILIRDAIVARVRRRRGRVGAHIKEL